MYDSKLYSGQWGDLNVLFCPAALAGNSVMQNRHQFDVIVPDIEQAIQMVTRAGGTVMGDITVEEGNYAVGIYDPDNNSITTKQHRPS